MFKEEQRDGVFGWTMLGNVQEGRPNLGPTTDVSVYAMTIRPIAMPGSTTGGGGGGGTASTLFETYSFSTPIGFFLRLRKA